MGFNFRLNEYKNMIPGLQRIENFFKQSDVKYEGVNYIHIAGTNGKGSTAKMLSDVLTSCGYKTGLYISPHLVKINERIQINGLPISDAEFKKLDAEYFELSKKCGLTFFEHITALALIYFKIKKADFVILETGLGGRFDATNIVTPLISIITSVDFDHSEILGKTLNKIAFEKAGIIKTKVPVICGNMPAVALRRIRKTAKQNSSKIYEFNKDFKASKSGYDWKKYRQKIIYKGLAEHFVFDLNLLGKSQVYNVASVLCACELLKAKNFDIDFNKLINVFDKIKWHGRFEVREVVSNNKKYVIVIDGAHNVQAIDNFLELYGKSFFKTKKINLIFAIMKEKEYKKIIKKLSPVISKVYLPKIDNERAVSQKSLYKEFAKYLDDENILIKNNVKDCLKNIKNNEIFVSLGSFYLAGKIIKFIKE